MVGVAGLAVVSDDRNVWPAHKPIMHVPRMSASIADGPVTDVDYIHVEYGHFENTSHWVNSTWKPTMEATKKAGLIIEYKVFRPLQNHRISPMCISEITFKNMAAYAGDIGDRRRARSSGQESNL